MANNAFIPNFATPVPSDKLLYRHRPLQFCPELQWKNRELYWPISSLDAGNNNVEFHIARNATLFLDLSSIEFTIKGRFVRMNGESMTENEVTDLVVPKSHLFASLFKGMEIQLNETTITQPTARPDLEDAVFSVLHRGYGDQDTKRFFERIMFDTDVTSSEVTLHSKSTEVTAASGTTPAVMKYELDPDQTKRMLIKRYDLIKKSNVIVLKGSLLPKGMEGLQLIPNGVSVRLKLLRNSPRQYMLQLKGVQSNTPSHYFDIQSCQLSVDWVKLYDQVLSGLETQLLKTSVFNPFNYWRLHEFPIPPNSTQFRVDRLYSTFVPQHLILFTMKASALNGSLKYDQHIFEPNDVSEVSLNLSRDIHPGQLSIK